MVGMAFKPRDCGEIKIKEIKVFSSIYSLEIVCNLSTNWGKR